MKKLACWLIVLTPLLQACATRPAGDEATLDGAASATAAQAPQVEFRLAVDPESVDRAAALRALEAGHREVVLDRLLAWIPVSTRALLGNDAGMPDEEFLALARGVVAGRSNGQLFLLTEAGSEDGVAVGVEGAPPIDEAVPSALGDGEPAIRVTLAAPDERLGRLTSSNVGRKLAIMLDGEAVMLPQILDSIDRTFYVALRGLSETEAEGLAARLSPPVGG